MKKTNYGRAKPEISEQVVIDYVKRFINRKRNHNAGFGRKYSFYFKTTDVLSLKVTSFGCVRLISRRVMSQEH